MLKQEDVKIAEETSVSSPRPLTLWGRQKMQTSRSQHSTPSSSLHEKVKELGRDLLAALQELQPSSSSPGPFNTDTRAGWLEMTQGEYSCTEGSFLRHDCLANWIKRNGLSYFPYTLLFSQSISSQAKSTKVNKSQVNAKKPRTKTSVLIVPERRMVEEENTSCEDYGKKTRGKRKALKKRLSIFWLIYLKCISIVTCKSNTWRI